MTVNDPGANKASYISLGEDLMGIENALSSACRAPWKKCTIMAICYVIIVMIAMLLTGNVISNFDVHPNLNR